MTRPTFSRVPPLHLLTCATLAGMFSFATPSHAQDGIVLLDPARQQGTWDGWGTSLCWWANVFGDRADIADLLFTTKTVELQGNRLPGLGLNVARYNAGACSSNEVNDRRMAVSKTILPFRQMEGFWLDGKSEDPRSLSWNWSLDRNQRAMLTKARERGANLFELFSNSPMWWMCKNGNPSGQVDPSADNLPAENYGRFAAYLATIARYAKDHWGVEFTTIEAFNEPTTKYWFADGKQEGCHFSPSAQAAVLPLLRRELDRRGLAGTPIAASDESLYDQAVATWQVFTDPTKALINQVNAHGYQNDGGRRDLLNDITRGKRLWNSEYGDGASNGLGLSRHLHLDFRYLRPSAWCYWQPFDGRGWGLIESDLPRGTLSQVNPKYYVLAQYTRHIRPGMTILETGDTDTVAAYDRKGHRLVLVVQNLGEQTNTKRYDLTKFAMCDGGAACWLTEPNASARYQRKLDATITGSRLQATLPAGSIATLEVDDIIQP